MGKGNWICALKMVDEYGKSNYNYRDFMAVLNAIQAKNRLLYESERSEVQSWHTSERKKALSPF
jgi:hypothetical protein